MVSFTVKQGHIHTQMCFLSQDVSNLGICCECFFAALPLQHDIPLVTDKIAALPPQHDILTTKKSIRLGLNEAAHLLHEECRRLPMGAVQKYSANG